jgi:hypothetical protein
MLAAKQILDTDPTPGHDLTVARSRAGEDDSAVFLEFPLELRKIVFTTDEMSTPECH